MATTAVVAGTATVTSRAVNNAMDRHQQAKYEAAQQADAKHEQQADLATKLQQLAHLKESGHITESEFQRAKAKLLAE